MTDLTPAAQALLDDIMARPEAVFRPEWLRDELLKVQAEARATAEAELRKVQSILTNNPDFWTADERIRAAEVRLAAFLAATPAEPVE